MEQEQNPSGSVDTNLSENKSAENNENEHDTVAYRTYQKVLGEAKTAKERAREYEEQLQELQTRVQSFEEKKLEEDGKLNDLVSHLRDKSKTLEQQLKEKEAMFSFSKTADAIKLEASKQGCVDTEAFMSLLRKDDLKRVEVGEGFQPNMEDVTGLVEDFKKRYERIQLFKQPTVKTNDPALKDTNVQKTYSKKDLLEMDTEDLEKLLKNNN